MSRPFRVPTRVLMAPGCLNQLPEIVAGYAPERVLMVTDPGIEETGWPERVWQALAEREIEAITFDDVEPNPRAATVDRLAEWGKEEGSFAGAGDRRRQRPRRRQGRRDEDDEPRLR